MEVSELQGTIYDVMGMGRSQGVMYKHAEDEPLIGKHLRIEGRELISFGSCSYLGLEMDERIKQGIHRATDRYGSQFSASRAYLSAPPYAGVEELLSQVFGGHALVAASTTLGHIAAIPVLCQEKDAIILDQQVHNSVQTAATLARANGAHVELVRHGDGDQLERRVAELCQKHRAVWYMIDGVYSMFGDLPDVALIERLLAQHPKLHLYVDDAHGMSLAGKNGSGVHLSRMKFHERMVLATSLNKAFAASGGVLVFPNEAWRDRVRLCGGTLIFSGPIQPPMLGAIEASARIHLSPEITTLQQDLADKISFFNGELAARKLPLLEENLTPIFFLKTGPLKLAYALSRRMMEEGYYISIATYPAVPLKRSGLRVSLTRHLTKEDLSNVAAALQHHYPLALDEVGLSWEELESLFAFREKIAARQKHSRSSEVKPKKVVASGELRLEHATTISALNTEEWDRLLGVRSNFTSASLAMMERTFQNRAEPENNWDFHYFIVRDGERPVAATFFTEALWKDDMLVREDVSLKIEEERQHDPYYLTSRAFAMGTLMTQGNHLYLDREGPWREGLELLLDEAGRKMQEGGCKSLILRDMPYDDDELTEALLKQGLVKTPILPCSWMNLSTWTTEEEFLTTLSPRSRKRVKTDVLEVKQHFEVRLYRHDGERPDPALFEHFYRLYRSVQTRRLRLNTFALPQDVFERMWETPGWEIISLHLSPEAGGPADGSPVAFGACYFNGQVYVPFVCGVDREVRKVSAYRQLLWRTMVRAKEQGATLVELGMDAETEKSRLGAQQRGQCVYVQMTDHFAGELMGQLLQDVSVAKTSLKNVG